MTHIYSARYRWFYVCYDARFLPDEQLNPHHSHHTEHYGKLMKSILRSYSGSQVTSACVCLFVLMFVATALSPHTYAQQVILDEDFEDGDFTVNPEWTGDIDDWIIIEEDGNNWLRLDAEEAGQSHLSTESVANYGEWEFTVRLDFFPTSNQNRAHVFLISDRIDTGDEPNGYAVRVGESGSDKFFRIVRFDGGSATVLVTGETLIEENITYRVRVVRDTDGEWSLFVAEGADAEPQPEGEPAVDNTYANAEWFSIRADYTITRIDRFFFDDILVVKYPLFLAGVTVDDNETLLAVFSEAVDPESVSEQQFVIQGDGIDQNPASVQLIENNIVELQLQEPLPGGSYTLSVEGILDLAGTEMEPGQINFDVVDVPEPLDVVINEFFYDEPGNFPQYVELFNNSDKLINLNNWRIQDNTSTIRRLTTEDFLLGPGEFVVLTGNEEGLVQQFGERNYLELSNFPSLNRASQDQIKIFTGDEVRIDSLTYDPNTWGGDDVALERRAADAVSYARENWTESTDALSGTPGEPNTAEPLPDPIEFTDVFSTTASTIVARFDRHIDRPTAENIQNYDIGGAPDVTDASKTAFNEVTLSVDPPMVSNTSYDVSVSDIESIFGIPMPSQTLSFTYFEIEPADSGDVFINEFMYDTAPGFSRYIELYNVSDKAISLENWTSNNDTGNRRIITDETVILPPESFIVLAPDNSLLDLFPGIPLINMGTRFSALKLGGDDIVIRDADGMLIDSLRYTPDWGGDEVALERRTVETAAFYPENWGDSPSPDLGTPGAPNEIEPDESPPELESVTASTESRVTLVFSKSMDPELAAEPNNYDISPDISITDVAVDGPIVEIEIAGAFESGQEYSITLQNLTDIFGNELGEVTESFFFFEFEEADPGDVLINEFFYDSGDETFPQYVEIFNVSEKFINLNEWRIQDNTSTVRRLAVTDRVLMPGEKLVLTEDEEGMADQFGDRNYLELSNFPSLNRASSDQIKIFTGDEVRMDSLTYNPSTWGGSGVSLERRSVDAITYAQDNWMESADPLGGTPGEPNTAEPDPDPLEFTSLSFSDAQTLIAQFNRHIDRQTAENVGNYAVSGAPEVTSLEKTASREVTLELDSAMENNTDYTVTIQDVETIFGVPMPEQSFTVTFFEIVPVDSGDVFINEFMYDVAPGFSRYIELYNASDKALDIEGWTSNNDTGNRRTITDQPTVFPPQSYIILAPDETLLDQFPDINLINMGNRFSALKLAGDDIVIRDSGGMLIDSLRYRPDWGGDEVALERRTVDVAAFYPENWGDSPSPDLGTPGAPNLIEPDETTPELISAIAGSPDELTLIFSKSMDPDTATETANYTIDPSVPVSEIEADREVVTLFTDSQFEQGTTYSITLQNLTDIFGNELGEVTADFTFLDFEAPESGDIVINEFIYRPVSGETPRFIELYNRSDRNINLHQWRLGRSTSVIQLSGPGGLIPLAAGEYLVISDRPDLLGLEGETGFEVSNMLALSMNGDSVYLENRDGEVVDSLRYEPAWGGNVVGFSLERLDPESASNDRSNWATHPEGHSAGMQNENFRPNETPPELIFSRRTSGEQIEIRFSEFVEPGDQTRFTMDGQTLEIAEFNPLQGNRIFLTGQDDEPPADRDEIVEINRIQDVPGNEAENLEIPVARTIAPGDLVINEIMFQPISGSQNDFPDQSEYVEFYNRRDYAVNMEGFFIHDQPDRDGEISAINPVSTESGWIPSGGYAVMFADPATEFSETRIAQFFEIESPTRFFRANRSTLSLNTTEDEVYLAGPDGTVIDSVFYSSAWHNPNLVDTRGIAIERINPEGESSTGENWGSSVVSRGGTPGEPNSLMQMPAERPDTEGIVMEPNPFSPDGSGNDDNLFINYILDQPDYLLRVRIYDRHGRLVRTLADGRPAGFEGTLTWDGRRDSGQENRIGIYIVLFEAYNSSSGSNRTFRETVVLARQL